MNPTTKMPAALAEMMAQALAIEREAVERYTALADVMEVHNNREVTELFRKMAAIEAKHAEQIMSEMGWAHFSAGSLRVLRRTLPQYRQLATRSAMNRTIPGNPCSPSTRK